MRRNGIETWATRPYTAGPEVCDGMKDLNKAQCNCDEQGAPACPAKPRCPDACPMKARKPAVTVSGYKQLPGMQENTTMLAAVAVQPVVALVDCEAAPFKNYKSGIIDVPCEGIHNVGGGGRAGRADA